MTQLTYPFVLCFVFDIYSKHIQFGVLSPQEIVNVSEFEVTQRDLYTVENRQPVKYGMLDLRLVRSCCLSTSDTVHGICCGKLASKEGAIAQDMSHLYREPNSDIFLCLFFFLG